MPTRKRSFQAFEGDSSDADASLLHRIRNMWHFANLCQWIYIFGKAAKIPDSIDVEVSSLPDAPLTTQPSLANVSILFSGDRDGMPQTERPHAWRHCSVDSQTRLVTSRLDVGPLHPSVRRLANRASSPEIFDEQTRKLFQARSPTWNPFGGAEVPVRFDEFDVFTKVVPIPIILAQATANNRVQLYQLRVLQQLTQWTMVHPERIRDKMEEQKDIEQTNWVENPTSLICFSKLTSPTANRALWLGCGRPNILRFRR